MIAGAKNADRHFARQHSCLLLRKDGFSRDHSAEWGVIPAHRGRRAMAEKEQLKPDDFPVHTKQKKIVKTDGKDIAEASTPKIAEDVVERLNAEEDRREQDRWA
jgi:hypothetical protein